MGKRIHLVMPMAGRGSRFKGEGFYVPKPLIQLRGKPFFYWATSSLTRYLNICTIDFVVLKEHIAKYQIDEIIKDFFPNAHIHILSEVTEGAVITSLKGIEDVSDDYPIIVNDCDHMFRCDSFYHYCKDERNSSDGVLLSFFSDDPKYSFVEKNAVGKVNRTVEKKAISNEAICGCYYFRNKDIFRRNAEIYLNECDYNEFYMSGVYNVMIEHGYQVMCFLTDYHMPFGTPEEYDKASKSELFKDLL